MRPTTGLMSDLQSNYHAACIKVLGPNADADYAQWWARRYAERENAIEDALGGICWDYPDRPNVCAAMMLLNEYAGVDMFNPQGHRAEIAKAFRRLANLIDGRK